MSNVAQMKMDFQKGVWIKQQHGFEKSEAEKIQVVSMLSDVQELVAYHDTQESKEKIHDLTNAIKLIVMERGLA